MCKLANDSMPYAIRTSIEYWWGIVALEDISKQLFQWFSDNQLKENPEKCQLICSTDEQIRLCKKYVLHVVYIQSSYIYVIIYCLQHHVFPVFKKYILFIEHAA